MSKRIFSENLCNFQKAFLMEDYVLAEKMEISIPRLRHWLIGSAYPQVEIILKICDVFEFKDIYRLVSQEIPKNEIIRHARKALKKSGAMVLPTDIPEMPVKENLKRFSSDVRPKEQLSLYRHS